LKLSHKNFKIPTQILDLDLIRKEKARRHLIDFLEYESADQWKRAKHLELLCSKLEAVENGDLRRLIVQMPPRHGKSECVSKKFPAWFLGRNPKKEMIVCSYSADLAYDFSRISRDTFLEWGPRLFDVELSQDSSAVTRWGIAGYRGGMTAAGVGGPITGRGAHVAIIDDPFKNWQDAASKTIRENVWNWYRSTLRTRLAPSGAIIIVMTRWHQDDIVGRILKESGDDWEVIKLPAIAEKNDSMGREIGEALWPERFPNQELAEIQKDLGSYLFSSLYQQSPRAGDGILFKRSWFRYFHEEELEGIKYYILHGTDTEKRIAASDCMIFQMVDAAATENEKSDYFVASTWAVSPEKDLLLLDVFRERAETTKHKQIMRNLYDQWRPAFQGVENKTFGLNIIQDCARDGLPIRPLKADTDKVSRSRPVSARYEIGTVYHRQNASWLFDWEDELISFPNGEYDDQVDTAAYAGIEVASDGATTFMSFYDRLIDGSS
jgi:predicted phage terminase large subunit-like protein